MKVRKSSLVREKKMPLVGLLWVITYFIYLFSLPLFQLPPLSHCSLEKEIPPFAFSRFFLSLFSIFHIWDSFSTLSLLLTLFIRKSAVVSHLKWQGCSEGTPSFWRLYWLGHPSTLPSSPVSLYSKFLPLL